jgi:hypothetical protein
MSGQMNRLVQFVILTSLCVSGAGGHASAGEIKCLFPLAFRNSLDELAGEGADSLFPFSYGG